MTRDYEQFPDNDNGNVLWQMVEDGNDLTEPHEVEFSIVFEKQEQVEKYKQEALSILNEVVEAISKQKVGDEDCQMK